MIQNKVIVEKPRLAPERKTTPRDREEYEHYLTIAALGGGWA